MASSVTSSNLLSESWQNVYDLVKAQVSDPSVSSSEFRKWVYSREPDVKSLGFEDFPFIVVYPSTLDFGDVVTVNGQKRDTNWSVQVDVVTGDRGYNGSDGKGQQWVDSISDSLLSVFNSGTHRNTLRGNGLFFSKPQVSSVGVENFKNTLIYRRTFLLSFKSLKKVY